MAIENLTKSMLEEVTLGWSVPIDDDRIYSGKMPIIHYAFPPTKEEEDADDGNVSDKKRAVPIHPDLRFLRGFKAHYEGSSSLERAQKAKRSQFVAAPQLDNLVIEAPSTSELLQEYGTHPGGMSIYLAEHKRGNDIAMLSVLPPDGTTTGLHLHAPKLPSLLRPDESPEEEFYPGTEIYKIVYGMAIIHHEVGDQGYVVPDLFAVRPGVFHSMEAGPKGAIFAILMKYADLFPQELRHIRPTMLDGLHKA